MTRLSLLLLLSLPALLLAAYDDGQARHAMLVLSAAAYSDTPQTCLASKLPGAQLIKQTTIRCDYFKDFCSGFVALSPKDNAIIVAFRGSSNALQIIAEASESVFSKHVAFSGGGAVSEYFFKAFNDVWQAGMKDAFALAAKTHPSYQLWVTGHSLGGAMASIAAATISTQKLFTASKIRLVTMGQPRTGNKEYANAVDRLVPASYRITHQRDIVPHIPPEVFGYYHHSNEVFYDNDMSKASYKVCGKQEDKKCSDGNLDMSITDHTHYFGKEVSGFGHGGCKA